jgi:glutamate/tyrosine decarboxylase-like PLP-dependent enzyme
MGLRQVGREGYVRLIGQDMALARHLYRLAESHGELEALAQGLSVTVFRYVPPDLGDAAKSPETETYLSDLNKEIQDRLERGGRTFVSNAVVNGKYALRACIVNFNTTAEDVEALPRIVTEVGREVRRELGGSGTGA